MRYQTDGRVILRCGSLHRIARPVVEPSGAIAQLLLPLPAGCQSLAEIIPLVNSDAHRVTTQTARAVTSATSGYLGTSAPSWPASSTTLSSTATQWIRVYSTV